MAITWQSVAAPSFGAANQLAVQGGNQVTRGLESLANTAGRIRDQGVKNSQAELQNQLLSLATDSNVGEKQFLAQAIKLGRESGLTPEQSLSQIDSIKGVRDQAAALTTDQQLEFDNMSANLDQALQLSQDSIDRALQQFDQQNPQVNLEQSKLDAFQAGGGLGALMEQVYGGIEDSGDRQETREEVLRLKNTGNYDDYVVGQVIQQLGVGEEDAIFDFALINSKRFKDALKAEQARFDSFKNNATSRLKLQQDLQRAHANAIRQQRNELLEFQKNARQSNLQSFSF